MAQRRRHGGVFKARVAVEAIAGHKTVNEIAGAYEVHPSQVAKWKAEGLKRLPEVLSDGRKGKADQGSQFTSGEWIEALTDAGVAISMDGRGRVFDNIFTERLWRSVKYEEVCLKDYDGVDEARRGLGEYFGFYNT